MDMDNLFKEKNQHTLGMLIVAIGKGIKKHVNQEVYNKKTKNKAYRIVASRSTSRLVTPPCY